MSYVKEKNCLEDEKTALVSCKISEKIIDTRSTYFVKSNLCLGMSTIIFVSPHENAVEFSDGFPKEKHISIPRMKNTSLVNHP